MRAILVVVGVIGVATLTYVAWRGGFRTSKPQLPAAGAAETVALRLIAHAREHVGAERFEFAYEQQPGTAKFALEVQPFDHRPTEDNPFTVTAGTLLRVASSRGAADFLSALGRLHDVEVPARLPAQLQSVSIDVGVLAVGAVVNVRDWNIAGRYSTKERGDWLVLKLFIPVPAGVERTEEDEDHCEVFFAINKVDGVAEFSAKDPSYGLPLLAALSQVVSALPNSPLDG